MGNFPKEMATILLVGAVALVWSLTAGCESIHRRTADTLDKPAKPEIVEQDISEDRKWSDEPELEREPPVQPRGEERREPAVPGYSSEPPAPRFDGEPGERPPRRIIWHGKGKGGPGWRAAPPEEER